MLASAAAVAGLITGLWLAQPGSDAALHDDVVASHVASLRDARRLTAIASDDRHAIKPWFQGKVDFAPAVRNLADDGFALLGARLDHVGGRQAAALVYRIRNHVINVFVWRATDGHDTALVTAVARGYSVTAWADGGLRYAAISDVDPRDVERLARLLRGEPGT
jgi:anti-sigma factor RsiW